MRAILDRHLDNLPNPIQQVHAMLRARRIVECELGIVHRHRMKCAAQIVSDTRSKLRVINTPRRRSARSLPCDHLGRAIQSHELQAHCATRLRAANGVARPHNRSGLVLADQVA